MERDEDSFDLDDEFTDSDSGGEQDLDRFIDRVNIKKTKPSVNRAKAAWSQLEDVLADRRLKRQLDDFQYDEL